ncbi:unnamed protein product, partial [Prorocentrum cordatum]
MDAEAVATIADEEQALAARGAKRAGEAIGQVLNRAGTNLSPCQSALAVELQEMAKSKAQSEGKGKGGADPQ